VRRAILERTDWISVDTAPLNEDVKLLVTDGQGGPYILPHPCRLTETGWVSSSKGTPLTVRPVKWKPIDHRAPEDRTAVREAIVRLLKAEACAAYGIIISGVSKAATIASALNAIKATKPKFHSDDHHVGAPIDASRLLNA